MHTFIATKSIINKILLRLIGMLPKESVAFLEKSILEERKRSKKHRKD